MSVSEQVRNQIKRFPEGKIFGYRDFAPIDFRIVSLTLSRLARRGAITRVAKGKYYIPKKSRFGTLGPSDDSLIESVVKSSPGSYVSGTAAFNRLGLTTQLPTEITIVSEKFPRRIQIGKVRIRFKKGVIPESAKDIPLLQILDAIRDIKRIQDSTISESTAVLKARIRELTDTDVARLVDLSFQYRPFTRALLGVFLAEAKRSEDQKLRIRASLNFLTKYRLQGLLDAIPLAKSWGFR
jgi:hypothetical protein